MLSQTAMRRSTVLCSSRTSSRHPSRMRSERSSSKTEPTISPHCVVPMPLPTRLLHGSPPQLHSAIAVLYARVRYHSQLASRVSGGVCQREAR